MYSSIVSSRNKKSSLKAVISLSSSNTGNSKVSARTAVDSVAVPEQPNSFSLQKTISTIEQRLDSEASRGIDDSNYSDDDVMPAVANEMGVGR